MSSVVVKSGCLVHPKVTMKHGVNSREEEILGMNQYLQELVSWSNQGSVDFGREIAQAARWQTQITWGSLTNRAVRLFSLLKAAFNGHGRISLLIQGFSEGLDIVAVAMQGDFFGNSMTYMGNGYELLRQLVKEFSLRFRRCWLRTPVDLVLRIVIN